MPDSRRLSFDSELHGVRGGPTDPTHDERLRRGIIDTSVSRPIALALTAGFLLSIYALPLSQAVLERIDDEPSSVLGVFKRAPSREHLREFEKELEEASFAKSFVQPRVQLWLSRFGRVGNKRAVIGREGWLFYMPGIAHLAGPSFLDRDAQHARELEARQADATSGTGATGATNALQADPLPAIFAFQHMLAQRGIRLVLFPVPDKTMLQPLQLHGRGAEATASVARNPGWDEFIERLRKQGVPVFDAAPARLSVSEPARFLVQDTHWTPAWMEQVARELAQLVTRTSSLPPVAAPLLRSVAQRVERVGDLVDMLKLPESQTLFRPQTVTVHQLQNAEATPWEPDRAADVLLLGDSFTNVFTLDRMEWGEAAGLAPQLSAALGRPLDVIAQNDSGAFATRQALWRELSRGEDRLAGKRVVIWEFAARELSVGDWKLFDWSKRKAN
jgi:alginate O-acetyltransferase complex protein AlgJ